MHLDQYEHGQIYNSAVGTVPFESEYNEVASPVELYVTNNNYYLCTRPSTVDWHTTLHVTDREYNGIVHVYVVLDNFLNNIR
jgi:hypothetical protein